MKRIMPAVTGTLGKPLAACAAVLLAILTLGTNASAKTFTGRAPERCNPNDQSEPTGSGEDFYHPKNWGTPCDPVPPPTGGDDATIPAGFTVRAGAVSLGSLSLQGTLIVSGNCTIGSLNISGSGQILSAGNWNTLTVGSVINMDGGTIGMHILMPPGSMFNWDKGMVWGDLTQMGGALMYIRGSGEHLINSGTFTLNGVTTWNGNGVIRQVGGTDTHVSILNKGTFLADGSGSFATDGGYLWFTFSNEPEGEFIKDGSSTTTTFASTGSARPMYFLNKGTLDVRAGVFRFTTGQLVLENGSKIKGEGKTTITAGSSLYIRPSTTSEMTGILELDGGYMEGDGAMTGNGGTFNWVSGSLGITQGAYEGARPASLNIPAGMTINILGPEEKRLGGSISFCGPCHRQHGVINNAGTANWTGTGDIVTGYGGGSIVNSGTFIAHNDEQFRPIGDGGGFTNTSTGTLRKQDSTGTTSFEPGITLSNSGTADVRTGTVQANAPANLLDGSRYSGAGKLVAAAGGSLVGTATVLDGGSVEWRSGTMVGGNQTITQGTIATEGTGLFDWVGGKFCGTVNVGAGSTLRISGTGEKYLGHYDRWYPAALDLNNAGTILWTEGKIMDEWVGRIHNTGTFTAALTGTLGVNQFNNTGTVLVPAGTSPYTVETLGPIFNTAPGMFDIRGGELVTKSDVTLNAGSVIAGAGRLAITTNCMWNGSSAISGTFELRDGIVRPGTDAAFTTSGSGRFEWTKGKITGTFTVPEGARMEITGAGEKRIGHYHGWSDNAQGTIINRGTIAWTGTGAIVDENTARIQNYGTFSAGAVANLTLHEFLNHGTFLMPDDGTPRSVGLFASFHNHSTGVLDIRAGELVTKTTFTLHNGSQVAGGGKVLMTSDSRLNGTVTILDGGTLEHRDTILRCDQNATIATATGGRFEWAKGPISGTVTIAQDARFDIVGDGVKWIGHYWGWSDNAWGIIHNHGVITWTGTGALNDGNTGHLYNYGTMNVRTTAPLQGRLQNEGLLNIDHGGGIDFTGASVVLTATGTVNLELAGPAGIAGRITSHNNVALNGKLNVTLAPDFQPVIGTTYTVVNRSGGQFSKIKLPTAQYFTVARVEGGATTLTAEAYPKNSAAWKEFFFADEPDSPLAQLMADADGDGLPNLVSYAFGKDPLKAVGAMLKLMDLLVTLSQNGDHAVKSSPTTYMAISYQRPGGNSKLQDIRYIPERSTTLAQGSWSTDGVIEESVTFDPVTSMETVVIRSTTPKGAGKEFLRVRVEQISAN